MGGCVCVPAVATYITSFGAMFRLKEVYSDSNNVSLTYEYDVGLSLAGWAVAFVAFVLQVADLQSTGFANLAAADALVVKAPAQKADVSKGTITLRASPLPLPAALCACASEWSPHHRSPRV